MEGGLSCVPRKAGARKVPEREKAGVGDFSQACTGQEWPEGHTGQGVLQGTSAVPPVVLPLPRDLCSWAQHWLCQAERSRPRGRTGLQADGADVAEARCSP